MASRFGRELKIYAKGRKVVNYLTRRNIEIVREFDEFEDIPTARQSRDIAGEFAEQYKKGEIGRFSVVYNRFFSVGSQQAQTLTVFPVSDLIDDLTTRSRVIWTSELTFEDFMLLPDVDEIFESLFSMMIRTSITGCFLEAAVSEHLSRVMSMRSASDNASEMIEDLTKEYNRRRQGQITVELLDIIAGVQSS